MERKLKDMSNKTSSFVRWCLFSNEDPPSNSLPAEQSHLLPPRSTAYFTGLRGIAAVFVYNYHLAVDSFPNANRPFVSWHMSSFFQLPVVRIIYGGLPMVTLFFFISGFVLSIKPLRLARQGKWMEFSRSLASSVFRRGPRLFLPCLPSTFAVMLAAQLRLFPENAKMAPKLQDSLWAQFVDWVSFVFGELMNIWSFEPLNPQSDYGPHLWTIPFEFRDSMILYISVLGTAALRPKPFFMVNLASLLFSLSYGKWDTALFLGGILIANSCDRPILVSLRQELKVAISIAAFFIGLYLASLPFGEGSLWFCTSGLTATGVGLVLLMAVVTHNSWLQRILSSKPIQFLGDISFSFYIIHEPILQLIGWRMVPWFAEKLGGSLPVGLVCTWMLLTPILFFLANLYTRFVEKPSLTLARWLERRFFVDIGPDQHAEPELLDLIS